MIARVTEENVLARFYIVLFTCWVTGLHIFSCTVIIRKLVFKIRFFGADPSSQAELFTSKKLPEFE